MLIVKKTHQFKKDLKLAWKQRRDLNELEYTMDLIATKKPLPPNYRDHALNGDWMGRRECHINGRGDWLLIYKINSTDVIFERVETHSELFS